LLYIIIITLSFFLHAYIHELSHLYMTKALVGVNSHRIRLYPHIDEHLGFVWASVYVDRKSEPTKLHAGLIYFAPRIANIIFILLFATISLLSFEISVYIKIIIGASAIDLFIGSLGLSERSDLRMYSKFWSISPWLPRVAGVFSSIIFIATII